MFEEKILSWIVYKEVSFEDMYEADHELRLCTGQNYIFKKDGFQ